MPAADISALKNEAARSFRAAVRRADPNVAVMECTRRTALPRPAIGGQTIVIALGKAAPSMMHALIPQISGPRTLICVTHRENTKQVAGAELFRAGHPVPDEVGAHAALRVQEALRNATADDVVIALISGGGSALLPAPPSGVTLDDKQALNRLLLKSGMNINAMNAVRQQVSTLKGGGFLRLAAPAPVTSYILSDVIGDDLRAIASGPTISPIASHAEVRDLLQRNAIFDALPETIRQHLSRPAPETSLPKAENHLIGTNRESVKAAAAHLAPRFDTSIIPDPLVGDVATAAAEIHAALLRSKDTPTPTAVIWGGETTVNVQGAGLGGRNQELAFRLACLMDATPLARPWVFLSAGTDGRDGPTEAAGGIVDQATLDRVRACGGTPTMLLDTNDSHTALRMSDDLLITGATGTNVADIQILILG